MLADPSFLPLENLPVNHPWRGPAELKNTFQDMLAFQPANRPTITAVLHCRQQQYKTIDMGADNSQIEHGTSEPTPSNIK